MSWFALVWLGIMVVGLNVWLLIVAAITVAHGDFGPLIALGILVVMFGPLVFLRR